MSLQSIGRAFVALWWTLGVFLFVYSVQAAWHAVVAREDGFNRHVALLASVEAMAALLFVIPKTMRVGGVCLLAVFTFAFVLHGTQREFASQLLLYVAAVSFITVHGPVPLCMLTGRSVACE
jgi:hypothetical protein